MPRIACLAPALMVGPYAASAQPSLDRLREAYRCEIVERLERIHAGDRTTSRDRFITVWPKAAPDAYVQCIFFDGDRQMLCEAASGLLRRRPPRTPPGDPASLQRLGFAPDPKGGNDRQELALGDPPDLGRVADLILATLHDAYGLRAPTPLALRAPRARRPRAVPAACPAPVS